MVLPFDIFRVVSAYARHLYVLQDTYKLGDVAAERVVAGPNLVPWILSRTCDLVRCCKDLPTRKAFYIWKIVQSHCDPTVFFALGGSAGVVYSFPPLTELATLGFRNAAWLVMETVPDTERNLLVLGFLDRLILFSVDQRQTLSTVTCESSLRVPHIDLAQMASLAFLNSTIGAFVVGRHVQIFCISKNEIQILHRIVGPRSTARANPLARFIKKAEPNQTYELFVYDGLHWCRVFPNAGRKKRMFPAMTLRIDRSLHSFWFGTEGFVMWDSGFGSRFLLQNIREHSTSYTLNVIAKDAGCPRFFWILGHCRFTGLALLRFESA